jgi:hypothetical protein
MDTALKIRAGIEAIPGLRILGEPVMSVMALASDEMNIYDVGDEMGSRGWHLDRQQFPPSLHMTVMPVHGETADDFLRDLADAAAAARRPSLAKLGSAAQIALARAAASVLPERWVSRLTAMTARGMGRTAGSTATRSAAMYGMMGSLPNRGDLHELVLDILDGFTRTEKDIRE